MPQGWGDWLSFVSGLAAFRAGDFRSARHILEGAVRGPSDKAFLSYIVLAMVDYRDRGSEQARASYFDAVRFCSEAQASRNSFNNLSQAKKNQVISFLDSLVLFGPDDTASNLSGINTGAANYPQNGHGSIALTVLFNNPNDRE